VLRWRTEPRSGRSVIVDLDGVLSDAAGRQHFLDNKERADWEAFFDNVGNDPLVFEMHRLLELLDPTLVVVLLTARPGRVQAQTLAWLEHFDVRWDLLVMRPDDDHRPSNRFKQGVLEALRGSGFDVLLAVEDDRRNVAMFRDHDVPCLYIHSGYYE
jgi:phosphoglycolate phosphatase-like HAD superfamily hydrolase